MFSANMVMNPPSDSIPAMMSVVVVSKTSRSSSFSPSISESTNCEIRSSPGLAVRSLMISPAYSRTHSKAAMCSGPFWRVTGSDCTISTARARTSSSLPGGRQSSRNNTLPVTLLEKSPTKSKVFRPSNPSIASFAACRIWASM